MEQCDRAQARREIRRRVRRARQALSPRQRFERSHRLCRNLATSGLLRRYQRFSAFIANDGEIDIAPFMAQALAAKKAVYVPVIDGTNMWFQRLAPTSKLVENRFGIMEPVSARNHRIALIALDVVLLPLVAFDACGHRIGMGGGFYDRSFAFRRHRLHCTRPRLIGVAFEEQFVEHIPSEPWDVPLDGAMTDCTIRWFGSTSRNL